MVGTKCLGERVVRLAYLGLGLEMLFFERVMMPVRGGGGSRRKVVEDEEGEGDG